MVLWYFFKEILEQQKVENPSCAVVDPEKRFQEKKLLKSLEGCEEGF